MLLHIHYIKGNNSITQHYSTIEDRVNPTQNNAHYQNFLALYNANLIDDNNDKIRPDTTVIINESTIIDIIDESDTNIIAKHRFHKNDLNATIIRSFQVNS